MCSIKLGTRRVCWITERRRLCSIPIGRRVCSITRVIIRVFWVRVGRNCVP